MDHAHLRKITLHPGEHRATKEPVLLSTLLGSCVAACLYDREAGVAGMNHFLLAAPRYSRTMPMALTDAGRYGVHAMELLITDMQKLGALRKRLKAKAFGGGSVIGEEEGGKFLCVSEVNVRFIREYLAAEGIPLESEDLGGRNGRVIRFRTDTFKAYRKYIPRTEVAPVVDEEKSFWKESLAHPADEEGPAILF